MEPILCATMSRNAPIPSSYIDRLQDEGWTHVMAHEVPLNRETDHWVRQVHNRGMKFIVRWPDWSAIGLTQENAFRAYDGLPNNQTDGRTAGPSHWREDVTDTACRTIGEYVDLGVDGVILHTILCDRPFPTDWYAYPDGWRWITAFWSFDGAGKRSWGREADGFMMPPRAISNGVPPEGDLLRFYRWYQSGWLAKLHRLTDTALGAGFRNIWTWYVPLDDWTEENMADGTADSLLPMEGWRRRVVDGGADAVFVNPCMFGWRDHWHVDAVRTMTAAHQFLGWRSIVGMGCSQGADTALHFLQDHGCRAPGFGYSGINTSDVHLRKMEGHASKNALQIVRDAFAKEGDVGAQDGGALGAGSHTGKQLQQPHYGARKEESLEA